MSAPTIRPTSEPFIIRPAAAGDRAFIENAWRGTMLQTSPAVSGADPGHFHGEMTRVFERLFSHATARVACDPFDPDNLVAFMVATPPELHYVYVAQPFRRLGVVPALLEGLEIKRYTFKTVPGERRLHPRDRNWVFTPRFTL